MEKRLKVWIEKEGFKIDKETMFNIDGSFPGKIQQLERKFETILITLERQVSVEDYQNGYIGKYENELRKKLLQFLQEYALIHGNEIVINPRNILSNISELYESYRVYCEDNELKTLEKPTGISAEFIYQKLSSDEMISLAKKPLSDEHILLAIDWYNAGVLLNQSVNQFIHFFVPLEILAGRFVTIEKTNWKTKYPEDYEKINNFLKQVLEHKDDSKLSGLRSVLSDLSFRDQVKEYFQSIFTADEIANFWNDDSDITLNGKIQWKRFKKMSEYPENKEKVDLYNVIRGLYSIRNSIIHYGLQHVSFEDIVIMENILRRVLKKELMKY